MPTPPMPDRSTPTSGTAPAVPTSDALRVDPDLRRLRARERMRHDLEATSLYDHALTDPSPASRHEPTASGRRGFDADAYALEAMAELLAQDGWEVGPRSPADLAVRRGRAVPADVPTDPGPGRRVAGRLHVRRDAEPATVLVLVDDWGVVYPRLAGP